MVLAGTLAGWRSAKRHDVSLCRSCATTPYQAGSAALVDKTDADQWTHCFPQVVAQQLREAAFGDDGQGSGLHQASIRGLRPRDDRVRRRKWRDSCRRGDYVLELCGSRIAALRRAARPGILNVVEHA